jgi:hypothetical protein
MRYHSFHEIPDLPLDAFKHFGDRRIRPQGGGGGIPIVSDVVNVVSDVGQSAVDVVNDAAQAVKTEIVQPVVNAVDNTVKAIEQDPLGSAAKIGTAIVAPAYLPAVVAADAIAKGEPLDKALEQAAKTYVAQQVAAGVSNQVNQAVDNQAIASNYGTDVGSQQTGMLAAQESGLGSVSDVTGNVAGTVAGGTAAGIIRGQDPLTALKNSGITAGTVAVTDQIPGFSDLSPAAQKSVNAVIATALQGGDPSQALVNTAINLGIAETRNQLKTPTTTPPSGTLVASSDNAPPTVDISGAPIFAESSNASKVTAPFGFDLMPASMADKKPEGSYYDIYQNAWFMPNQEATNLQQALQTEITPTFATDSGALSAVTTPTIDATSPLGSVTAPTPTDVGEIVITGQKEPYTGDIQMDLSGQPVTTPTTTVTQPTPTTTATTGALPSVLPAKTLFGGTTSTTGTSALTTGGIPAPATPVLLSTGAAQPGANIMKDLPQLYPQLDPRFAHLLPTAGKKPDNTADLLSTSQQYLSAPTASKQGSHPLSGLLDMLTAPAGSALASAGLQLLAGGQGALPAFKEGGEVKKAPVFITGKTGHYVKGHGDGQSDDIPAMLADGEYVFDADTVAALGNGSSDAGAAILDKMRAQPP